MPVYTVNYYNIQQFEIVILNIQYITQSDARE